VPSLALPWCYKTVNRHCLLILRSPIEVRTLNPARRSKALPSGVWGGAPAEIEFGAFQLQNMTSGGSNFNDFPENQLTKMSSI